MWLGSMMGPMEFIMRKLGPEALEEVNEEIAKGCSVEMKERGVDDALKFAMDCGVVNKDYQGRYEIFREIYVIHPSFHELY